MDFKNLDASEWEAVVIGAGPAGSVAAHQVAKRGLSVLLVDKARFPRTKVCGSCVSERALGALEAAGLSGPIRNLNPPRLSEFRLTFENQTVRLPLRGGISLSREKLDFLLVEQAIGAGVCFLQGTRAALEGIEGGKRWIRLEQSSGSVRVKARVVLVSDGIGGESLGPETGFQSMVRAGSRMGLGTVVEENSHDYPFGTIHMAVAREGYVGVVRLEDGRLNVAAALDPLLLKSREPFEAVAGILEEAGLPEISALAKAHWRGTPLLTRRPKAVSGNRFFILGDAAGYAEPFTGEGIAWAVETGRAVASFAQEGVRKWDPSLEKRWMKTHQDLVSSRQQFCRLLTLGLRQRFLLRIGMKILSREPGWAVPLVSRIHGASPWSAC